jgi:hypothetical protein
MKIVRLIPLLLGLILMCPQTMRSQDSSSGLASVQLKSEEKALAELVATNSSRGSVASILYYQRKALVATLMTTLDSTNSDEVKMRAVVALGEYQASEVVPFAVAHLDWDDKFLMQPVGGGNQLLHSVGAEGMPMVSALTEIGMPAIPEVLKRIANTEKPTENTIRRCVLVCVTIEGGDVTRFRLQGLLEKATDQKQKDRIQSALDALKHLSPAK